MAETETLTLTEFLTARLDEDEAMAQRAGGGHWEEWALDSGDAEHIARHDPARVLAEVAAKRAIVEACENDDWTDPTQVSLGEPGEHHPGEVALAHLAAIYSDHPDYCEEWRP